MTGEGYYQEPMNSNISGDAKKGYITTFMGWNLAGNWGVRFQWNHRREDGAVISGDGSGYNSYKGALHGLWDFLKEQA